MSSIVPTTSLDTKGDEFTAQAEQKRNACCGRFFLGQMRWEQAAALYSKAAFAYKSAHSWANAASTFEMLAHIWSNELKSLIEAKTNTMDNFMEAGRCYKKFRSEKAKEMFAVAIAMQSEDGNFATAAMVCGEMGEMLEMEKNFAEAAQFFLKGADGYEACITMEQNRLAFQKRAAENLERASDYVAAIRLNEDVISAYEKKSVTAPILDMRMLCVRNLLMKLLLTVQESKIMDYKMVESMADSYMRRYACFDRSQEHVFIKELIDAIADDNTSAFQFAFQKFSKIREIDSGTTQLLHKVLQQLDQNTREERVDFLL